jgi:hypothetical protein
LGVVEHYYPNIGGETSEYLYQHRRIIIGPSSRTSQQGVVKQRGGGGRFKKKWEINGIFTGFLNLS